MGDRVAVMREGVLQQCDSPRTLYDSPVNAFVAGFIGSPAMNLIEATFDPAGVRLGSTVIAAPRELTAQAGSGAVTVGLRPESLELVSEGGIPAIVSIVEELGAEAFVYAQLANHVGQSVTAPSDIIARVEPRDAPAKGDLIHVRVKDGSMLLFDSESGVRITERP